jgi:hypothetical protein
MEKSTTPPLSALFRICREFAPGRRFESEIERILSIEIEDLERERRSMSYGRAPGPRTAKTRAAQMASAEECVAFWIASDLRGRIGEGLPGPLTPHNVLTLRGARLRAWAIARLLEAEGVRVVRGEWKKRK